MSTDDFETLRNALENAWRYLDGREPWYPELNAEAREALERVEAEFAPERKET